MTSWLHTCFKDNRKKGLHFKQQLCSWFIQSPPQVMEESPPPRSCEKNAPGFKERFDRPRFQLVSGCCQWWCFSYIYDYDVDSNDDDFYCTVNCVEKVTHTDRRHIKAWPPLMIYLRIRSQQHFLVHRLKLRKPDKPGMSNKLTEYTIGLVICRKSS